MRIRGKRCPEVDGTFHQLELLVLIYLWITNSHHFVCLSTLELTTFAQQVCSAKIGCANGLSLETNMITLNNAHQAKKQCSFDRVG